MSKHYQHEVSVFVLTGLDLKACTRMHAVVAWSRRDNPASRHFTPVGCRLRPLCGTRRPRMGMAQWFGSRGAPAAPYPCCAGSRHPRPRWGDREGEGLPPLLALSPPPRPPPRTLPTPFRPLRLLLAVAGRRAADLRAHGHPRHVVCGGGHLLPPRRPAAAARGASGRPTLLAAADSLVADRGGSGSGRTVDGRCAAATTIGAVGTAGANGGAWGGAVAKRHRARGCSAFNLPRRGAGCCTPAAHPSGAAVGGCGGAAPADGVARPGPPARHVPLVCADGG